MYIKQSYGCNQGSLTCIYMCIFNFNLNVFQIEVHIKNIYYREIVKAASVVVIYNQISTAFPAFYSLFLLSQKYNLTVSSKLTKKLWKIMKDRVMEQLFSVMFSLQYRHFGWEKLI